MHLFHQLLISGIKFEWNDKLNRIFEESKLKIIEVQCGVLIFDKTRTTYLATDWPKSGIGYRLSQKYCTCPSLKPTCCNTGWKIALIGSRFTYSAESRYAPIKGDAQTVSDALDKARYFVVSCHNLIVAVDHKPLLKIFGDKSLDDIPNSRLRNLKKRTFHYCSKIIHIPGVKHKAAGTTSRNPTGNLFPSQLKLVDDTLDANDD